MNFGDFENGCTASNFFSVVHIRENKLSQDTQYQPRRSPRKKLRTTRTSASLVIDQLKNGFRRPGDFTPRMRTRRNWRPEFLIKYLRDNRCDCNEERIMMVQHRGRSFVPETPKICSIGLHPSTRSLSDSNDLTSLYSATRNFKRRFDIVLRPMFICEYWVEKSTPTSSSTLMSIDALLKTQKNRQIAVIDCTESANISKYDGIQKNDYNQSFEYIKDKSSDILDSLQGDYAAGDRSFISNDYKDSFVKKEYRSCITRDAQIQTSARKSLRRKKMKKRSKLTDEGISHRKHHDNEIRGRIIADFRVDSQNSNQRNCYDKSRLRVQVLESKRIDYINKFTAVNRQMEEITATLRETCYNDDNSRSNLENCEEYFSSVSDDAKVNTNRESNDVENKSMIARGQSKKKRRKDNSKENIRRVIRESESDRHKNMLEVLHVDNINDELLDPSSREYSKDTLTPAIKLKNIYVRDSTRMFSIDRTVYPLIRNSGNKKKGKCRFVKKISFDLDLTKNDDKPQEFSIEAETYDKAHVRNNFIVPNYDKQVKDLMEDFAGLEESRYRKKIVGEEMGEMAILEDIKKRIDRDIDDRSSEKGENDTEDFLTLSQKSSNFDCLFYEITSMEDAGSVRTIEDSKSTSLIVSESPNLDLTGIQIRNSISADAMSERSNKNSTLSEYFSCMQFPSMVSFAENDDEPVLNFENHGITAHDSNSFSNYNYYDCSHSNLNINNFTRSNLDASFDCSYSNSECVAEYISPNKFPTRNATTDTFELSEDEESFVEDKICEPFLGESKRKKKESRVEFEKRYTADSTFETSKSSRYIGSIDSGVFSSSLIDLYPRENFVDKSGLKKKRRVEKLDESSPLIVDFNSDSSCTDDTLDQRVNDVVRDLTEKLILCERRMKLKKMRKMGCKARDARYYSRQTLSRTCKLSRSLYDAYRDLFNSPRRSSENERILSISTPTLLSLSDSEIENRNESRC
ncbi:uncharacterized protein [Polyergus mexicanus]|uniref:uncharacterized protein n=1 Tax=Polyergus mexicanus TaxID=615972 RepID=UPI0038B46817